MSVTRVRISTRKAEGPLYSMLVCFIFLGCMGTYMARTHNLDTLKVILTAAALMGGVACWYLGTRGNPLRFFRIAVPFMALTLMALTIWLNTHYSAYTSVF